jgi:hypothetical protein
MVRSINSDCLFHTGYSMERRDQFFFFFFVHSLITSGNQSPKVAIKGEKKTEKLIKSRKSKKK